MEDDSLAQLWLEDDGTDKDLVGTSLFDALAPGPSVPFTMPAHAQAKPKGISSAPSSPEPKRAENTLPRNASSLDDAQIRDSDAFTAEFGPGFTPFPCAGGVGVGAGAGRARPGNRASAESALKRPLEREESRNLGGATAASYEHARPADLNQYAQTRAQPPAPAHLPDPPEPAGPHNLPDAVSDTLSFPEAWFMLASDTYSGMGVRPNNIPPPLAPSMEGAIFKEFHSDRGMRRKRKARRGSNEQGDTWQFKGGPKGFCRSYPVSCSGGGAGEVLVERNYGSVTLTTPTGEPPVKMSAHRYRVMTTETPAKKAQDTSEIFHLKPKGAKAARGAGNKIMQPMSKGAAAAPPGSPPVPPRGWG